MPPLTGSSEGRPMLPWRSWWRTKMSGIRGMFAKAVSSPSSLTEPVSSELLPKELHPPLRWKRVTLEFQDGNHRVSNKLQYWDDTRWIDVPTYDSRRKVNDKWRKRDVG